MNCVVICCDTFRYDMIGHDVVKTPNLNRLAAEGVTFENAFAEGLPTIQARRTMFTGIRSFPWRFEMGSRGLTPAIPGWHRIPDEQTALAEHLWEAGVCTGLVADTYHMFKPTQNFTRGFCSWDFVRGQEGDVVRSGPLSAIDVSPYHPEGVNDLTVWPTLTQYLLNMLDRHCEEDYLPARVFRSATRWLDDNRENAPWMLWVDSFAPHERWDPPVEFADAYYTTDESRDYIQPQLANMKSGGLSDPEIKRTMALYWGYVTFVDKWIGTLLATLEQMGRFEDTAVIFTSDHGTELMDHDQFGKSGARLYRYNTGVPLIVRLPGGAGGGTVRTDLATHLDFFPTICGLMDVDASADGNLDGRDLFDAKTAAPEKVITAWGSPVSVRDEAWNLVIDSRGGDRRELYDLSADPVETTNVYDQHPDVVKAHTDFLEATLGPLPYEIRRMGDRRQSPPLVICRGSAGK